MELVYAVKLLAKTTEDVDKELAAVGERVDDLRVSLQSVKDVVTDIDNKLAVLPLVLAKSLEDLIQKRSQEAYEDIRLTLDELRNKLYAIKKQIKDQTGAHQLPPPEKESDGISVRKGGLLVKLPWGDGWGKALKIALWIIGGIAGIGATSGGIWALVDRLKHLLGGG
jgi:type II secretory pathway component PulJ